MSKKEEKAKVGRPKLADEKMKRESIIMCVFITIVLIIIAILGYKTLTIDFDPRYMVGTVYNDHVNSCVIKNSTIDCGPNVSYLKYQVGKEAYQEVSKEDKVIIVKIKDVKNVNYCYKVNDGELKCKK